jgi:nucleotide-binding universal stress UspA family protein
VHIPVGHPAVELTRVANRVRADLVVLEPHGHEKLAFRKLFRRSLVARIARNAPCTVLAIRKPRPVAEEPVSLPMSLPPTWSSAGT